MEIHRITQSNDTLYQMAIDLYGISFPAHEQREKLSQLHILRQGAYHVEIIIPSLIQSRGIIKNEFFYFISYNNLHRVVFQALCFMNGNCVSHLEGDDFIAPFFTCIIVHIVIYRKTNHRVLRHLTIEQLKTGGHLSRSFSSA